MFGMGMGELVVVFLIIMLLFGAKRLPEMAEALGRSVREFKKATHEVHSGVVEGIQKEPAAGSKNAA